MLHLVALIRVRTESWILEKVLKFAQRFSRPGKSLENGDKVWKNGKKSWVYFQSYNKWFISEILFRFGQILFNLAGTFAVHREKSFVLSFFKVCIDQLFDNLESGKRNYCFGKSLEKVVNLYEPCLIVVTRLIPPGYASAWTHSGHLCEEKLDAP